MFLLPNPTSVNTQAAINININKSNSTLQLNSTDGNITVNSATLAISLTLINGSANINYDTTEHFRTNSSARVLFAKVVNGTLTATGVEYIGKVQTTDEGAIIGGILITGNGTVNIKMDDIYSENSVKAEKGGNVRIVVDKDLEYSLTTSSNSGSVRVNLTQTPEYNGYTTNEKVTTNVNCYTKSSNTLDIDTNLASITVYDTNFA